MVLCITGVVVTAYTPYAVGGKGPMAPNYGSNVCIYVYIIIKYHY